MAKVYEYGFGLDPKLKKDIENLVDTRTVRGFKYYLVKLLERYGYHCARDKKGWLYLHKRRKYVKFNFIATKEDEHINFDINEKQPRPRSLEKVEVCGEPCCIVCRSANFEGIPKNV